MGMFDTVVFTCPRCDSVLEEQSKAGECVLSRHNNDQVPPEIAKDIEGTDVYCDEDGGGCGSTFKIVALRTISTVPMGLVKL